MKKDKNCTGTVQISFEGEEQHLTSTKELKSGSFFVDENNNLFLVRDKSINTIWDSIPVYVHGHDMKIGELRTCPIIYPVDVTITVRRKGVK